MSKSGKSKAPTAEEDLRRTKRVLSVFEEQDAEGNYLFPDDQVREFLPLMVILSKAPIDESLKPKLLTVMDEFLAQVGLDRNATREELEWACDNYYAKKPLNRQLADKLKKVLSV